MLTLKERFLNLPNYITFGRLMVVFVLMILMAFMNDRNIVFENTNRILSYTSAIIFLLGMLSDIVDGYLARRKKIVSTFGKFFDPLADKLAFLVVMIQMVALGRIPAWMVSIFLAREVIVTALRGVAIDEGIVIAASNGGKYKTVFVTIATMALMIHYPLWGIQWRLIGWVFIFPALFFSILSGFQYTWGFVQELKKMERNSQKR